MLATKFSHIRDRKAMRMKPIFMNFVFSVLICFIDQFESKDGQETLAKLAVVIFLCSTQTSIQSSVQSFIDAFSCIYVLYIKQVTFNYSIIYNLSRKPI